MSAIFTDLNSFYMKVGYSSTFFVGLYCGFLLDYAVESIPIYVDNIVREACRNKNAMMSRCKFGRF